MNPMAMALKSRRSESAKPAMQDQLSGPPVEGEPDGGGDKLKMLVSALGEDEKAQLLEMLQADTGEGEPDGESHEDLESGMQDKSGQTKNTSGEIEALKAEAQGIFSKGQGNPLGEEAPDGEAPRGLGDRLKQSISKHFKK